MKIKDINFGKVDAKLEFSEQNKDSGKFFDAFSLPENVDLDKLRTGERYFISGFRGTGKTSLLRYYVTKEQPDSKFRNLILFKSDVDEDHRVSLSKEVGYEWVETESSKMEIAQDFKSSWRWFVLHKIGEMIKDQPDICSSSGEVKPFLDILGLGGETAVAKVLGVFPRLKAGKINFTGDIGILKAELQGDFENEQKSSVTVSLRAVVTSAEKQLLKLRFCGSIILGFDELEAFYTHSDKYKRDLSMVRDLLFVVDQLNQKFRANGSQIYLIAAIRSEVLHSMKSLSQEVDRSVHDSGIILSWHHSSRSMQHPILNIFRNKLKASGIDGDDPLMTILPKLISGDTPDRYLLDSSFYKPRDLVWRFTIIQNQYPNIEAITQQHFQDTVDNYSQKMWDEVAYELNATYSDDEVSAIKSILSGFWRYFYLSALREHADAVSVDSSLVRMFLSKKDFQEMLHTLYRLGAIGNDFPYDQRGRKRVNRWVFRNDPDLLIDKQMALNAALWRALSTKTKHGRRA